jgi:predicted amidohydrolase YtcJ
VFLRRVDGHAAWLNKTAMDVLGIDEDTRDPAGGRFLRDANGQPTGVVMDKAEDWVRSQVPEPPFAVQVDRMRLAIKECNRYGLTGVHDAGTTETYLDILQSLRDGGDLTLRVYTMLDSDQEAFARSTIENGPTVDSDHLLTVRALKLYADGALGSRGALLLEPYADEPSNSGLPQNPPEVLEGWARLCIENGFQVCTHAIGDGGNRMVLDVYEKAIAEHAGVDHRFRVEHAQVLAPADIARFSRLRVIPSMQPTHCTSDMYWAEDRIGAERIQGAYAWRQLIDSGCVIPCGSDFPVEGVNPLWGVYAAVTRQDQDGWPEGGWRPEERMTVYEALRGFTLDAAHAEFAEHLKGSLKVGKLADFTVLGKDPFTIEPRQILSTHVVYTIVGGRIVYSASEPISHLGERTHPR